MPLTLTYCLRELKLQGVDLDPEDFCDAMWLAARGFSEGQVRALQAAPQPTEAPAKHSPKGPSPSPNQPATPERFDQPKASPPVHALGDSGGRQMRGTPISLPTAPAMIRGVEFDRSMRPLRQRRQLTRTMELDEEGTVAAIAETGIWQLVMRPARGRWLDITLVVEQSPTMRLWQETAIEFRELLWRACAPRSLRTFHLDWSPKRLLLQTSGGRPVHNTAPCHGTGSHLIMVLSDAMSYGWLSADIPELLARWASIRTTTLVQMLPQSMWKRSALRQVTLSADNQPRATAASRATADLWPPVIIATLDPDYLRRYTRMLTGAGAGGVAAYRGSRAQFQVVSASSVQDRAPFNAQALSSDEVDKIFQRFERFSSPEARKLARHLASAPLVLPIMRLVQRVLVPDAAPAHLAEIFLSGILCRRDLVATSAVPTNQVEYEFLPGVREHLRDLGGLDCYFETIGLLRRYFEQRLGKGNAFSSLLEDPTAAAKDWNIADSGPLNQLLTRAASIVVEQTRVLSQSVSLHGDVVAPDDLGLAGARPDDSTQTPATQSAFSDNLWNCPLCHQPLTRMGQFWICSKHGQVSPRSEPVASLRIFLSYGHDSNEELVHRIGSDLSKRGHDVWFDKSEIKAGEDWRRSITEGIAKSDRFVCFLSKHSTRDPGVCLDEIAIAIGVKGGNIQTILVESEQEVQPPVSIGHIQWLDMHDWKEQRIAGETAWEQWYHSKFAEFVEALESDESRRFSGEIATLNDHLKPIRSEARISQLLSKDFYGRQWLFEAVEKWRKDTKESSRLLWITGAPGSGKSAFAAKLTSTRGDTVIASYFCEWDKPDHRDARRVVRSLAFQLATRLSDYRKLLLTLPEIAELDRKDPAELFDYILANPLRSVVHGSRERYLIVIDALDEAGEAGNNPLVEMLARHAQRLPDWLGLVITSRPESAVQTPLQGLNPFVLDTRTEANRADLRDYLRHQLAPQLQHRPDADRIIGQILEKSEGSFLYAERVCSELLSGHLSLDRLDELALDLGGFFAQYFQRQFPDLEKYRKDVLPALRAILAARAPLPVETLQRLFGWREEELRNFTHPIVSLFPVTTEAAHEVIKPYHKSLADWLSDASMAGQYFVSIEEGHRMLASLDNQEQTGLSHPPGRQNRVFLSHTTAGLATLAEKVAVILEERGFEFIHQPDFGLEWRRIRHILMEKIRESDTVVCLVGPVHGAAPATPIPEFRDPETGREEFSYTQLEFLIARRLHKPVVTILVPDALCTFLPGDDRGTPAQQALQANFICDYIKKGEHVYHAFTSEADLLGAIRGRLISVPANPLPPPSPENIPFSSKGTVFTGRSETLRTLRESFISADTSRDPAAHVIHGTGGVGKTSVTVEYAHAYANEYTARLFIRGNSPGTLDESLAALAGIFILNLEEQDEEKSDARIAAVLRWLAAHPGYLLVIDNVDTDEARDHVLELLAKLPSGHVLITSRLFTWPGNILHTALDVLSPVDSRDLLLKYRSSPKAPSPDTDDADALALATELDGLPLALEQAAAYLNAVAVTIAEYHQRWKTNAELVRSWHDLARVDYPASVATTWLTSFEQLAAASQALLNLLSWLAPDPIPRFLLKPLAEKKLQPDPLTGTDPYKALGELIHFSLARPDNGGAAFAVHRLIQQIARERQEPPVPAPALITTLQWVVEEMPTQTDDVRTWPIAVPLVPHAIAVATFSADRNIPEPTTRLLTRAAVLLNAQANYVAAEPLMRRALAIDESSFGNNHPNVARTLNNLAAQLQATNRLAEAEPLMRRALAIDQEHFGDTHPNVARDLNNLAALLETTNRLAEAEPLMRRALSVDEASYGSSHPKVATRLNNLAQLLQATNRLAEAEPLMRRTLAITEASYGKDHPEIATALNNLARLLQSTNRLAEAEPLMRRALDIQEASMGTDHPSAAVNLSNLATLLQSTNRLAEAEPLLKRAISIFETAYGSDHPNVATSLANLAVLLAATDRTEEAEPLLRRALAIDEASFGGDHPSVAIRLNNLARVIVKTGNASEANALSERAVRILREFGRQTGHEHPHLQAALSNHAAILETLGQRRSELRSE